MQAARPGNQEPAAAAATACRMRKLKQVLDMRECCIAQLQDKLRLQQARHAQVCRLLCMCAVESRQNSGMLINATQRPAFIKRSTCNGLGSSDSLRSKVLSVMQVEAGLREQLEKRVKALEDADKRFGELQALMQRLSAHSGLL